MQTQLLADAVSDAASGKFNLRAVNVATGIGTVDIYLLPAGSTIDQVAPTFSGVAYGGTAAFTQFATGDYDLVVARAGSKDVIYDTGKQTMAAKAKVTLLVYATGSGKLVNGALLYSDTSGTTTFIDSSLARFKFVNAATDIGSVDVLVDGTCRAGQRPVRAAVRLQHDRRRQPQLQDPIVEQPGRLRLQSEQYARLGVRQFARRLQRAGHG